MRLFTPSTSKRLNEVTGFLLLAFGLVILLGLASYHAQDPSWDTAAGETRPLNLTGPIGAHVADLCLQAFGAAAFLFPLVTFYLGWKWMRSEDIEAPVIKLSGCTLLFLSLSAAAGLAPDYRIFAKSIPLGGATGTVLADILRGMLNLAGAVIATATGLVVSIYLVSAFTLDKLAFLFTAPVAWLNGIRDRWQARRAERRRSAHRKTRKAAQARQVAEGLRHQRGTRLRTARRTQRDPHLPVGGPARSHGRPAALGSRCAHARRRARTPRAREAAHALSPPHDHAPQRSAAAHFL
jgi:S-DNA-T family DNA segregation ATPase FtsK/SpoIIIE